MKDTNAGATPKMAPGRPKGSGTGGAKAKEPKPRSTKGSWLTHSNWGPVGSYSRAALIQVTGDLT